MLTLLKEKRLKVVEEEIYALIPFYSSDKIIHLMLIHEPGNDGRKQSFYCSGSLDRKFKDKKLFLSLRGER